MHLVQARILVMIPAIGNDISWRFGLNDRVVVCARFFHCPPATPV